MNIKKSLLVAGAVATVGLAGVSTAGMVSAATDPALSGGLVDKIATKFNLNKDEVKAVFEADHADREAQMQQKLAEQLDQAVSEGKLTADQKEKIIAKQAELKAQMESARESFKDKTKEEIKALMDQRHAEIEQWAEENDIPEEYMHIGKVVHKFGGEAKGPTHTFEAQ